MGLSLRCGRRGWSRFTGWCVVEVITEICGWRGWLGRPMLGISGSDDLRPLSGNLGTMRDRRIVETKSNVNVDWGTRVRRRNLEMKGVLSRVLIIR